MPGFARIVLLVFACLATAGPARAAKKAWRIAFVAPLTGPLQERSEEYLAGLRVAATSWSGSDALGGRELEVVAIDDLDDPGKYGQVGKALKNAKPLAVFGAPSGRCLEPLTRTARKRKLPLILLTPWEPRFSLDAKDTLVHFSVGHVDHAVWAAQYTMLPFKAKVVAALHDGSAPSADLAAAYDRNRPLNTASAGTHLIPESGAECVALLERLHTEASVDLVFVCGDADAAVRIAAAAKKASRAPALLFMDGLATPSVFKAAPKGARWLEQTLPLAERSIVGRYRRKREKKGEAVSPPAEKGFFSVQLLVQALRANGLKEKGLVPRLRGLPDPKWRNTPLCTEWGQQKLSEFFLDHVDDKGRAGRYNPVYLWDHAGGMLLRYRSPGFYKPDPEGIVVVLTWGKEEQITINDDLKRIGLNTGGYEGPMDEWVKEELLARALAYLNRLYWRNADGTPIPGVSFNITFGLDAPEGVKGHKIWLVTIAGDDPAAGGRAFRPNRAFTYSTFLERTMYRKHALKPKLGSNDVRYFIARYEWGTSKEGNIRHDAIRSLINGFAGAMSLTTAHECGHLGGLGHDTVTKRSIMNVADAAGLDPESGEWIPAHIKPLRTVIR